MTPVAAPLQEKVAAPPPKLVPRRRKPRRRYPLFAAIAVVMAASSYVGWAKWKDLPLAAKLPSSPARQGEFLVLVRARGELRARRSVQVTAPVNVPELRIVWLAAAGEPVTADQVVIRFDPSSARQQLNEKSAELQQAQAALEQAEAQARITAEQDRIDLAKARYEVERAELEASKAEIVSRLQGEESRIDLALSRQKLQVQEATVQLHEASSRSKIASLGRKREQAAADVELTEYRLAQMELKAPISGVIVYMNNFSQGWMNAKPFKIGDQAWPGAALAEVPDLNTLEMEAKLDEIDRSRIAVGNDVRAKIDSLPELSLQAKLDGISPLTQQSFEWPPTRSFRGYASIKQPDSRLRPGMNGAIDVIVNRIPNAISVPAKSVFTKRGKPVVYTVENRGYRAIPVEIAARNPDEVAVRGLEPGKHVTLVEPDPTELLP